MEAVKGHRYLWRRGDCFYFRRAIPKDASLAFAGRSEVWVSLKTSTLSVARSRLQKHLDQFEIKVAKARGELAPSEVAMEPYKPTRREIETGVSSAFKERIERTTPLTRRNPVDRAVGEQRLLDLQNFRCALVASRGICGEEPPFDVQWQAEALCEKHGWSLSEDDQSWWLLLDFVTRAQIEVSERQIQVLEGRPEKASDALFSPEQLMRDEAEASQERELIPMPVSLLGLFDVYVAERKPSPATIKSFRPKVKAFSTFVGHDDARKITKRDVALWKDRLLSVGGASGIPLEAKTVRETYLSAVKATLKMGVDNGLLAVNVASGVSVAGRKRPVRLRSAGFTEDEAKRILTATLQSHGTSLSDHRRLARRWLPWLCAYTGARIDEVAQLRGEDIQLLDDIWTMRITPEAGGTKDGNARLIALHPHLVEQGFQEIARKKDGPVFYDPSLSRGGSAAHRQSKKVGEHLARWVRHDIGISDKNVQPNHGWRHRFKTVARDCRMAPEVRDYIQGHMPRNVGETYGDYSPRAVFNEICLIPYIEI